MRIFFYGQANGTLLNLTWECFLADFRIVQVHFFHYLHDYAGNHQIPVPLVIGWYEIPRGPFRAGLVEGIFVRFHVLLPEFPLRHIVTTKLPPLGRIVQPLLQTLLLLILVNMELELQYRRILLGEQSLEIVNLSVPMTPYFFRDDLVNSLDKHALVMASVENREFSLPRHLSVLSPQETMIKFLRSRFLEVRDADPLRVDSLKASVADSVFAARIHRLQNN